MKKAIFGIIVCLYLVVTSGFILQFHYCMGNLESTSVSVLPNSNGSACGMASGKSACCHTENQWLKVADNHQPVFESATLPTPVEAGLLPVLHFYTTPTQIVKKDEVSVGNHSPPLLSFAGELHILYCIFRV